MISCACSSSSNSRIARRNAWHSGAGAIGLVSSSTLGAAADHRQALIDRIQDRGAGGSPPWRPCWRSPAILPAPCRRPATDLRSAGRTASGFIGCEFARGEIAEDLAQVFLAHALDELALLAHFAHAVEVTASARHCSRPSRPGRTVRRRCSRTGWSPVLEALERGAAHELEQLADAVRAAPD